MERYALDAEAVTSQVQLLLSAISRAKLSRRTSWPNAGVRSGAARHFALYVLPALFGIGRDPFSLTPEERVLEAYFDRFTAYAVDKSRLVVIEFQSRDPELRRASPTRSPKAIW